NAAVIGAVNSGLFAAGQACMSPERFLVPAASVQDFREALVSAFAEWPQGDPFSREIRLGLIADGRIVEEVQRQVREAVSAGAKVVHGGQIRELSVAGITMWELQPTILVGVTSDMDMMQRETMAPIFPVYGYRTVEEAMTVAEGTRYGLTATVFGRGQVYRDAAQRLARSHGLVFQNVDMVAGFEPQHWGSGGFKRSGWIWEWRDGAFVRREGRRDLSAEWHRIATGAK
ncbi:MAG TPA: aldehyde dehydrogenase family protein, partial [Bryobacteraceae bacterium]|nr:aldehyde dehydrogenase family protein [Bryobacteraceae bacterium]